MITDLLNPLVSDRFRNDPRYREGHLRVINALPQRKVMGLHTPEMKQVAKLLVQENDIIQRFESACQADLCYEETVIWGYLINLQKCPLPQRLSHLQRYIPVLDNWAVCDSYCAHAKWMARMEKEELWAFLQPWFDSQREFEVRFAVVTAMCYLLTPDWLQRIFSRIEGLDFDRISSQYTTPKGKSPYYVRMGVAWLLASALAKFPEQTRAFVSHCHLPEDVIRLYVRKARESFRTKNEPAMG